MVLLITILYVRDIITAEELTVETKESKNMVANVKPVKISLLVIGLSQRNIHNLTLKNTNSFDDLLEKMVKNEMLTYEKTEYIHGTEYDQINGEVAPDGYVWKVYVDDNDITFSTKGIKLNDKSTYKLSLEKM